MAPEEELFTRHHPHDFHTHASRRCALNASQCPGQEIVTRCTHPLQVLVPIVAEEAAAGVPAKGGAAAVVTTSGASPTERDAFASLDELGPSTSAAATKECFRFSDERGSLGRAFLTGDLRLLWQGLHMRCRPSSAAAALQYSDNGRSTPHLQRRTALKLYVLPQHLLHGRGAECQTQQSLRLFAETLCVSHIQARPSSARR